MARSRSASPTRERQGSQASRLGIHSKVARQSLQQILKTPLATGLVVLVIAVALLLPALLTLLINSAQQNLGELRGTAEITAYFAVATSEERVLEVSERLQSDPAIAAVAYVSADSALTDFSAASGLGTTLQELETNPLPPALVITPSGPSAALAGEIEESLREIEDIELVQLDLLWLQRLEALLGLASRLASTLFLVVTLGLFLIVGSVIGGEVDSRREEIRIIKQFGGADAYILRPFLYTGAYLGAAGGLLACLLLLLVVWLLADATAAVAALYDSELEFSNLNLVQSAGLVLLGTAVGWIAALLAVFRKIAQFSL